MSIVNRPYISGNIIRSLMRGNRTTIAALAERMNITMARVHHVRTHGVASYAQYCDWHQAITGMNIFTR